MCAHTHAKHISTHLLRFVVHDELIAYKVETVRLVGKGVRDLFINNHCRQQ